MPTKNYKIPYIDEGSERVDLVPEMKTAFDIIDTNMISTSMFYVELGENTATLQNGATLKDIIDAFQKGDNVIIVENSSMRYIFQMVQHWDEDETCNSTFSCVFLDSGTITVATICFTSDTPETCVEGSFQITELIGE